MEEVVSHSTEREANARTDGAVELSNHRPAMYVGFQDVAFESYRHRLAMAHHTASVIWEYPGETFTTGQYSRTHRWRFDGGAEVVASASPAVVPPPHSDPGAVDPEEAFVASLSSCHMLWFLSIAAERGVAVERYQDEAEGRMETDERGKSSITRVTLRPRIRYAGQKPTEQEEDQMHREAHETCFIANSVRTTVVVEPHRE